MLIVLALAGAIAFLVSEAGLPFVIARIVAQTGGHLVIEEPSGSIGGTMRFRRIAWNGDDLVSRGLFLDMAPWQACVFRVT